MFIQRVKVFITLDWSKCWSKSRSVRSGVLRLVFFAKGLVFFDKLVWVPWLNEGGTVWIRNTRMAKQDDEWRKAERTNEATRPNNVKMFQAIP